MSPRVYLDYNATSPLANSVKESFARGDFLFGNPSSQHTSGKQSLKAINQCKSFLYQLFQLDSEEFKIVFHSGATEGMNFLIPSLAGKEKACFFFSPIDHPCILAQKDRLEALGHEVQYFKIDRNGNIDLADLEQKLNAFTDSSVTWVFNLTWANNETGVIENLSAFSNFLNSFRGNNSFKVHVDAVQAPGKVPGCFQLLSQFDAYTFSGHKFGSFKGIGFSFVRNELQLRPLLVGGSQQDGLRAGTLNVSGIQSLQMALEELSSNWSYDTQIALKKSLEEKIKLTLQGKGEIVGESAPLRNSNTICALIYGKKSDQILAQFDLAGFDISSGSACSSGRSGPSQVLLSLGHDKSKASSGLRISLSPYITQDEIDAFADRLLKVFSKLI